MKYHRGGALARDGKTVVCDYGETTLRQGETVADAAERRYRDWKTGIYFEGYVPS